MALVISVKFAQISLQYLGASAFLQEAFLAIDKGLRLNEFGLFSDKDAGELIGMEAAKNTLICSDESEIYRHLGLEWVPPELREDMGELEAA